MIRIHPWYTLTYLLFLLKEIVLGSFAVARYVLSRRDWLAPSIVEFPLRCKTDLEVTWMASSITITPGTLVLATAAGTETEPATLFIHSMFGQDREEILADLRDMEVRLLTMTRGKNNGL